MKVIAHYDEKKKHPIEKGVNSIENLPENYKLLDIEEKYLPWLRKTADYIEPIFTIELGEQQAVDKKLLNGHDILFAMIGMKTSNFQADIYYNIKNHTLNCSKSHFEMSQLKEISCYSEEQQIKITEYMRCISHLSRLSQMFGKPIIIYVNINVPNITFRYRTAAYKIINSYLKEVNGLLIVRADAVDVYKYYKPSVKPFETYVDHTFYFDGTPNEALRKILPFIDKLKNNFNYKKVYCNQRQESTLYNSIFYQSIRPEEEIYVLLNSGNFREPGYYQSLGLKAIPIFGSYSMLYGTKSRFDTLSTQLRTQVAPLFQMPIVSYRECIKSDGAKNVPYSVVSEALQYKGRGVYIGVVTTDPVDYRSEALRAADGTTRITYIWEQVKTDEGREYSREQINEALASVEGNQILQVPERDSTSTMLLGIAGGESQSAGYRGVATEAEFIAAKINTASENLQRIYGGLPDKNGVLMHDVIIGAIKLINFATRQGRPLVLCIPFNGNVDPHDGSFALNQILGILAQGPNVTIITASGEEADKMHHFSVRGIQQPLNIVNLRVDKESQNIIGILYQRFAAITRAVLFPPQAGAATEPVNLKIAGITRLTEQTTIYCDGIKVDFYNGSEQILFRLDNPAVGGWRIELTLETNVLSQLDVWIAQQELNGYTTLRPSNTFVTVGSVSTTFPFMSVGGYDRDNMVVLKSSGRGFSWVGSVQPLFVTHASNIVAPCRQGNWARVTGTLPAAGIMLGVIATLYNKFIDEGVFPLPNTLIMNGVILEAADQFEGVVYPNESQGYGIFDVRKLSRLLATPLIV